MNINHLVKMANQIGDFFAAYPDRDEVIASIAAHLKNAWEPRMRNQIIDYVNQSGGPDLKEPVRQAILSLEYRPATVTEAPSDD